MKDRTGVGSGPSTTDAQLDRRILAAALIVLASWLCLSARLFYLQVVEGDRFRISAQKNSVRTHRVHASRGMILDRNGEILVDSRPAFDVRMVPDQAEDIPETLGRLASLLGEDAETVRDRFGRPRGASRFQAVLVAHDVDHDAAARVGARLWALPGVITQADPVRFYRNGPSSAHILGHLGEISSRELKSKTFQGYRPGDVIGKDGIERLLDRELRGRDGGRNVLVDAHGRELEVLDEIRPQPGRNVILTIDQHLQSIAEAQLEEVGRNGAVVAMDPRTGEILVLASRPSYDPNRFVNGIDRREWNALMKDPARPLHHRALDATHPPGSTYKVVAALAGLESGVIGPDFRVHCSGSYKMGRRRYRCWKRGGHGSMSVHQALVQSCDVFFYRVADILESTRKGVDELAYYARALGLGAPTGIEGNEAGGLVPTRAWKKKRFKEKWYAGETLSVAIGQGANQWTPIQLATVYAAIANGGTRYRPTLIKRIESPFGEVLEQRQPEVLGTVPIKRESLEIVREALRGVVHEPRGTGSRMRGLAGGVEAGGKTGTAQVINMGKDVVDTDDLPEQFRDHAWFATFVPAKDPRIVVAVLVEHGGHGGSAAAPLARAVVDAFLETQHDLVPPPEPEPEPEPGTVAERDGAERATALVQAESDARN